MKLPMNPPEPAGVCGPLAHQSVFGPLDRRDDELQRLWTDGGRPELTPDATGGARPTSTSCADNGFQHASTPPSRGAAAIRKTDRRIGRRFADGRYWLEPVTSCFQGRNCWQHQSPDFPGFPVVADSGVAVDVHTDRSGSISMWSDVGTKIRLVPNGVVPGRGARSRLLTLAEGDGLVRPRIHEHPTLAFSVVRGPEQVLRTLSSLDNAEHLIAVLDAAGEP